FTPFDEPWMHCWELDDNECEMSPDCKLESGDFGPGGGDFQCMEDCPMYPDGEWSQTNECTWLSDMLLSNCLNDCEMEIAGMHDMLKMQEHLLCNDTDGDCVGFLDGGPGPGGEGDCNIYCEGEYNDYCEFNIQLSPEFATCCPGFDITNCPAEEQVFVDQYDLDQCMTWSGLTGGNCMGCSINELANYYSDTTFYYTATDTTTFPMYSDSTVTFSTEINTGQFCGWIDQGLQGGIFMDCTWGVQDLLYGLASDCMACNTNSNPIACHAGVFGSTNYGSLDCSAWDASTGPACNTITNGDQCICDEDCEWIPNSDSGSTTGGTCKDFGSGGEFEIGGPPCLGDCTGSTTWDWDTQM
ncbi:uncharacterized protein METZ01_LOCUS255153, partial [marine metagenome]